MAYNKLPEIEYLRERLSYDPETGELAWKFRPDSLFDKATSAARWNRRFANRAAGMVTQFGYVSVLLLKKGVMAHRLAWALMTGEIDVPPLDHINGIRTDNRFANLRVATASENSRNTRTHRPTKTGLKGAYVMHGSKNFQARIWVDGKRLNLGAFPTKELAHAAYCRAAQHYFGEFWNGG